MPFRPMPALCVLLLAGCASSEPQNVSYAPVATGAAVVPAGDIAAQPAIGATTVPATPPSRELYDPTGQILPNETMTPAAGVQPSPHCSTVDGVTLCDSPADSGTDNFSQDDAQYTN